MEVRKVGSQASREAKEGRKELRKEAKEGSKRRQPKEQGSKGNKEAKEGLVTNVLEVTSSRVSNLPLRTFLLNCTCTASQSVITVNSTKKWRKLNLKNPNKPVSTVRQSKSHTSKPRSPDCVNNWTSQNSIHILILMFSTQIFQLRSRLKQFCMRTMPSPYLSVASVQLSNFLMTGYNLNLLITEYLQSKQLLVR